MEAVKKGHRHRHDSRTQSFFRDINEFTQVERDKIVEWWPWAMAYHHNMANERPKVPEDVIYDGVIDALIYSVREWDPEGGKTFKSWFHVACSMFTSRSIKRWQRDFMVQDSGDRCVRGRKKKDDGRELYLRDSDAFETTEWEDRCLDRISLDEVMSCLNQKEREIMTRIYVYNEKQSDIARAMGVTRQRVSFIHEEAIRKCREAAKEG